MGRKIFVGGRLGKGDYRGINIYRQGGTFPKVYWCMCFTNAIKKLLLQSLLEFESYIAIL